MKLSMMGLGKQGVQSLLICLTLATIVSCKKESKDKGKTNLLILQTDEHNFRTIGAYRETLTEDQALLWGPEAIVETPRIDQLAHQGVICTSFYATTPVCSPSRSSFMTGRYPQNTPVVTNDIPMADSMATFASILSAEGWKTAYFGKWHLDGLGKPQWEPERKFGFNDNRYMFNRGHWKILEDGEDGPKVGSTNNKGNADYGIEGATAENFTTDFLTTKAIEFIEKNKEEPFCVMVSYPDPHGPNTVRAPYHTMYDHIRFQKPPTHSKPEEGLPSWAKKAKRTIPQNGMVNYFGMVKCIDDNVGRLMDYLEEQDLMANTIVLFTSDHGDLLGEHGKDNKGNPFEGSAKSAFILSYPGTIPAGSQLDIAFTCVDFSPSILALLGVNASGQEEGRDLSGLFISGVPGGWQDVAFMRGTGSKTGPDMNWLSAVTDRFKLVLSPNETDLPWLYDLEVNPDETINYYGNPEYQETIKYLSKALLDYGKMTNDPRIYHPKISRELLIN